MDAALSRQDILELLAWQVELGADEALAEAPVDRFERAPLPDPVDPAAAMAEAPPVPGRRLTAPPQASDAPGQPPAQHAADPHAAGPGAADPQAAAAQAAEGAGDLAALEAALAAFPHCPLRQGARTTVFGGGLPGAHLMIVGDAPGREEDAAGQPFAGEPGALLDRMLAAIGLSRGAADPAVAVYLAPALPWRPPQNRDPQPEELALMAPFLHRQIDLAAPRLLIAMGNAACAALLGGGRAKALRGQWAEARGRPCLPMLHPAILLRQPELKREAWADLQAVKARLAE